jgi:WhiB family redox-sensing transcriptional regulator
MDIHSFDANEWRQHANCKGIATDIFYPERGCSIHDVNAAKAICNECPVIKQCLDYAIENYEIIGIWGGTSQFERRFMRRANRISNVVEMSY